MLLFSGVKIYTKWSVVGKLQCDDLFVVAAAVCHLCGEKYRAPCCVCANVKQTAAVAHCIAISEEVGKGLGQHQARVDSQTLNEFYIVCPIDAARTLFAECESSHISRLHIFLRSSTPWPCG